ncbi:DNA primase [Pedobacter antarcticus]|uniref:DNA primase n=1 Tax=Pedobacter antarcticus TaxID=34086 RepID=UPI0008813367|nr:DNA primase [Pedobacter antarcticus]SDM39743.1 DNA primase, catalytic core [Pedobacter antarcticus]
MIKPESIEELRDQIEILDTVESYDIKLKKRGSVYVGCCPFHNESTPSFTVSVSKGIFKCFGCGVGGDAISFVMKKDNMDFISAIRQLAVRKNFHLQEDEESPEEKEVTAKKADLKLINKGVAKKYHELLDSLLITDPVKLELYKERQLKFETIETFQIGYAPDKWQFITPAIVDKGLYFPAVEIGLIATSNDRNYDVYRNRIMFPIHDHKGDIVGFGGRKMDNKDKDNPKYLNAKESVLYKKDQQLYGLFQAQKHIRTLGFATIVEGYYDVLSCHQCGVQNAVASCGTSFTSGQAKLLKKYTNYAVLLNDGDVAGKNSSLKTVDILLKEGFKVDICPLPDDHDPDSFSRTLPVLNEYLENLI